MEANRTRTPFGRRRRRARRIAVVVGSGCLLAGCSLVATPDSAPVADVPLATSGPMGYVVCPTAVTPVELRSRTAEPPIPLPIRGTPALGAFAVTTSPDGRTAYVVTQTAGRGGAVDDVVVPVDLATQRAGRPIGLPGHGATHAVVVLPRDGTVLAAVGTTIVPVDPSTRAVGTPLDLGPGRTVFGMALSPTSSTLWALVPGGVVPVDTATARAGTMLVTGLTVSSVSSPHGLLVAPDGSTLYVVGQGGTDFGGRLLPVTTSTGTVGTATSFDQFGISDPVALALTADGSTLLVADSANNWLLGVPVAHLTTPVGPVRLPTGAVAAGTDHPSDIVVGPGSTGAFVVTGLDTVLPYTPTTGVFGTPVRVCSGASSMAVATG